jgi:alpha-N-arabinofuranosidase
MTPEYYTNLYKHWSTFLRPPWGTQIAWVASGGHGEGEKDRTRWSEYLTANIEPNFLLGFDAVSFHYYTHPKGNVFEPKGAATGFPEAEWLTTLVRTREMASHLAANAAVMDENDPEKKIALYVDEWGTWYDATEGSTPGFLVQQNTLRDAVVAALNFHIFHDYADRVRMANIAQMVNVLQAMILTEGARMVRTPTYHAFKMYVPFQGASVLPVRARNERKYRRGSTSIPALSVTAARAPDGRLLLAVVNVDPTRGEAVQVRLEDGAIASAEGQILTAPEMDAHNTFEKPDEVRAVPFRATAGEGGKLAFEMPPKSIVVLALD